MTTLGVTVPYYGGGQVANPANVIYPPSVPSSNLKVALGTLAVVNATGTMYGAVSHTGGVTTWAILGGATGAVATLTGTSGGAITPVAGNINILGIANQIIFTGTAGTLTASLVGPYTPATYTAHGVLIGEGTSSIAATAAGATGQVLTGVTGADPIWQSTTSTNIVDVTSSSQAMAINTTYIADATSATVVFTLPATAPQGSRMTIIGNGPGGWQILQNASQGIKSSSQQTTIGTNGSLSSTSHYNTISLFATVAGTSTIWVVTDAQGSVTFV